MHEQNLIIIDGSQGGGQILRTALALSIITGKPFRIINIRKSRPKAGLQPQHLEAVNAAVKISDAEVKGAELGSCEISFTPKKIQPGHYDFKIKTAGSISLLLHCLYLPLSIANKASKLILGGGTHVPWSPTYDYLKNCWLWFMNKIGLKINIEMKRAGFYPHGGGIIESEIQPCYKISPITLLTRGPIQNIYIYSAHTNLNDKVAIRQAETAKKILSKYISSNNINIKLDSLTSDSKNTTIAIKGIFKNTTCCYTELGEKGKPAECVAEEACNKFIDFINTNATLDDYMADQILLPISLSEESSQFICKEITQHMQTNIDTICKFIKIKFQANKISEKEYKVIIRKEEK
jgi:RNA 3'-terminal phosphate cyclase (ATP)